MAYLHAANVLHCDLKPGNVLLKATTANKRGFICKLADFGMSRLLDVTQKTHLSTQTYGVSSYHQRDHSQVGVSVGSQSCIWPIRVMCH